MQAYLGMEVKHHSFLISALDMGDQNIPIPTEEETGCAPEPVWRFVPTAKRTTIHQYA